MLGKHALLHVMLVDEDGGVEPLAVRLAHPGDERFEPLREDEVIVLAPGVARDLCGRRAAPRGDRASGATGRRPGFRVIHRPRHDHRPRRRQEIPDVRARVRGLVQVDHLAGVAAVEPLAQACQLRQRRRRRDAAEIEPERLRARLDGRAGNR